MEADTLISVKNLSRYYGDLCAVDHISFELKRGQILGFLGPNGAGKSTTMQMLTGTLAPTTGHLSVGGYDLLEYPLKAKATLGYLPEQPPLYKEMVVQEYLRFCAQLHHVPRPQITKAVNHVIDQCHLGQVKHRLITNLSKGYQQRVGIAQAIIHLPEVVILDEPTIGLDPIQIREIRQLIQMLGEERSIILSTHILSEVQAVCSHVQIIHQGKLVLSDTIDGLFSQMQNTQLTVALRRPPSVEILQTIPGVEQVKILDNQHFIIRHSQEDTAERIAEYSAAQHWGLYELIPQQHSLEQIFVDLTENVLFSETSEVVEPKNLNILTQETA